MENYFDNEIKQKQIIDINKKNESIIKNKNNLFESFDCFDLNFKNRFCFYNFTDEFLYQNATPKQDYLTFYENIAKSDVGLIFTGGCSANINKNIKIGSKNIFLENKENIKYFSDFTKKIHAHGCKIFYTIKSKYGRQDRDNKFVNMLSYSPSLIRNYHDSRVLTARFSDEKCNRLVNEFATMAKFAQTTNFDGIMIDGTINEILGEFSSKEFNRRKFGYFSELLDLPLKTLSKIDNYCKKFPIIYKINLSTFINNVYKKNKKVIKTLTCLKDSFNANEILEILTKLVKSGIDGFLFEFGLKENEFLENNTPFQQTNLFLNFYKFVKEYFESTNMVNKFNEGVKLILKDNIDVTDYFKLNSIVEFVDITKNIYSNINYLKEIKTQKHYKSCIKCNKCADISQKYGEISCLINPELNSYVMLKPKINNLKPIAVIGAGVSGIVCTLTLARRGYKVDLYEKDLKINKIGRICEVYDFDKYLKFYNNYLDYELEKYAKNNQINLKTNTLFNLNKNLINNYSCIVVATGFHEKFLNVTGAVLKNVKTIYDTLSNKNLISSKKHIVIYAKSELSFKLALYLSSENKKVSIIINKPDFLFDMPNANLTYYLYIFSLKKINIELMSHIRKIDDDSVELIVNNKLRNKDITAVILNMKSNNHYSYVAESKTLQADLFVYEPDLTPNNKLYYDIVNSNFKGELYLIGNALTIGDMYDDIKSGFYVGKNI